MPLSLMTFISSVDSPFHQEYHTQGWVIPIVSHSYASKHVTGRVRRIGRVESFMNAHIDIIMADDGAVLMIYS